MNTRKLEGEFRTVFLFMALGFLVLGLVLVAYGDKAQIVGFPMTIGGVGVLAARGLCKWSEWRRSRQ